MKRRSLLIWWKNSEQRAGQAKRLMMGDEFVAPKCPKIALSTLYASVHGGPGAATRLQSTVESAADSLQIAQQLTNGSIEDCTPERPEARAKDTELYDLRLARPLPRCEDQTRYGASR